MVAHLDDLGRGYDVHLIGRTMVLSEQLQDALLVAKEDDAAVGANFIEGHYGTLNGYFWGEIATHRINTNL